MCPESGKNISLTWASVSPANFTITETMNNSSLPGIIIHHSICLLLPLLPGRSNVKFNTLNKSYFPSVCKDSGRVPRKVLSITRNCVIPGSRLTVVGTRISLKSSPAAEISSCFTPLRSPFMHLSTYHPGELCRGRTR